MPGKATIDNGMPAEEAAAAMLAAIEADRPELILATGFERDIVTLRRSDPDALFEQMSAVVRAGYAQRMAADSGRS